MSNALETKTIAVVNVAAEPGQEVINLEIGPGTTPADVLLQLNLPGYALVPAGSTRQLGANDNLWNAVEDGAKLNAVNQAVVGR